MKPRLKRIALIVAILVVAVGGAGMLGKMKPPPQKKDVVTIDPLVQVVPLRVETATFTVASQGTVQPRTQTILSAEVSGSIVEVSDKFIAGGVFAAGETLLRIDPVNFTVALEQAQALRDQRSIEYEGAKKLRSQGYRAESELASAAAALASAKAELVRAQHNLERTHIRLPYAGMVMAKEADIGQFVNPGTRLGVTFATDFAEVRLPLSDQDLAFLTLPQAADIAATGAAAGPQVRLSAQRMGQDQNWQARISRTEGVVDEQTRVSYAVARVVDPYSLTPERAGQPVLPMGTFVTAQIEGITVADVIPVPRTALRGNRQLLVVDDDNRLQLRSVQILRADADDAYISSGVDDGEQLVLTALENPINGMRVRIDTGPDDLLSADALSISP